MVMFSSCFWIVCRSRERPAEFREAFCSVSLRSKPLSLVAGFVPVSRRELLLGTLTSHGHVRLYFCLPEAEQGLGGHREI